jgi:hypothetical protein
LQFRSGLADAFGQDEVIDAADLTAVRAWTLILRNQRFEDIGFCGFARTLAAA